MLQNIYIQTSFFPYTIVKWNKVDANLKNAKSYYMCFRNYLLKIVRASKFNFKGF